MAMYGFVPDRLIDVYKNGKKLDTMYPERRFYKASEQTSTIVANRSRLNEDRSPGVVSHT